MKLFANRNENSMLVWHVTTCIMSIKTNLTGRIGVSPNVAEPFTAAASLPHITIGSVLPRNRRPHFVAQTIYRLYVYTADCTPRSIETSHTVIAFPQKPEKIKIITSLI